MKRILCLVFFLAVALAPALHAAGGPDGLGNQIASSQSATGSETPPAAAQQGGAWMMPVMLIGLIGFMYLVMIRPQKKEQQKRQAMLGEMKVGEQVVTIGGLHGTIVRKGEAEVGLEIASGITVTFNLGAIHERLADRPAKKE
jgi:preprotein translocase YajC subunit